MKTVLSPLAVLLALAAAGPAAEPAAKPPYDPIEQYAERTIEGWRVLVHRRLLQPENADLCGPTLELLGAHLYQVRRVVPGPALEKLRRVPIWVELNHPRHPCMCYHVSADWLREHGMNPHKAGAVEIANARNFLGWTHQQPWMVLHELAHAYHHRVVGFGNAEVRACYDEAVRTKGYEAVLHGNGRRLRAYALSNDREYFAEASEAFFGTNDFYPFVRAELKRHDPRMHDLLAKLWGVR